MITNASSVPSQARAGGAILVANDRVFSETEEFEDAECRVHRRNEQDYQ